MAGLDGLLHGGFEPLGELRVDLASGGAQDDDLAVMSLLDQGALPGVGAVRPACIGAVALPLERRRKGSA